MKLIAFSSTENYLVTWSPEPITVGEQAPPNIETQFTEDDEGNQIAVWDIKTGQLLRTFLPTLPPPLPKVAEEDPATSAASEKRRQIVWPALKWSGDDKYVARITPGSQISVYELPGMGLVDKKSVKVEGVVDFEWCPIGDKDREAEDKDAIKKVGVSKKPRESMFAYWTPEIGNQPARVSLLGFPSRTILRSKNLFSVSDVCASTPPFRFRRAHCICFRLNSIGRAEGISCVSKLTDIPRQRSPFSVTSKFSVSVKRIIRSRS